MIQNYLYVYNIILAYFINQRFMAGHAVWLTKMPPHGKNATQLVFESIRNSSILDC